LSLPLDDPAQPAAATVQVTSWPSTLRSKQRTPDCRLVRHPLLLLQLLWVTVFTLAH
jgi:hypothetical protein